MSSSEIAAALRTGVRLAQRRVAEDAQALLHPEQRQSQHAVEQPAAATLPRTVVVLGFEQVVGEGLVIRNLFPLPLAHLQDVTPIVPTTAPVGGGDREVEEL